MNGLSHADEEDVLVWGRHFELVKVTKSNLIRKIELTFEKEKLLKEEIDR